MKFHFHFFEDSYVNLTFVELGLLMGPYPCWKAGLTQSWSPFTLQRKKNIMKKKKRVLDVIAIVKNKKEIENKKGI